MSPDILNQAKERLESALILLIHDSPFYLNLIIRMRRTITEGVDVAAVMIKGDKILLQMNPNELIKRPMSEVKAILKHECLHVVFMHMIRCNGRNFDKYNCACDLAINSLIGKEMPEDALVPSKWQPVLPEGLAAEEYYDLIKDQNIHVCAGGMVYKGQDGKKGSQGKGGKDKSNERGKLYHDKGAFDGELSDHKDCSPFTEEIIKAAVKDAHDKSQGCTPSNISEIVDLIISKPRISWQALLRQYTAAALKYGHKYSWKKVSRRFGDSCQGRGPDRKIKITCAIDTSGSISTEDFNSFASEVKGIQASHNGDIEIIECDAEIQKIYKLKRTGKLDTEFKGRGGCLGAGAEVLTPKGYVKIEDIKRGDKVFAHDGHIREVLETYINKGDTRTCYEMNTNLGQKIILTENHPLYVIQPGTCRYGGHVGSCIPGRNTKYCSECKGIQKPKFIGWKAAGAIAAETNSYGWYVRLPKLKGSKGTYDEGYFEGYFIGDGWTNRNRKTYKIEFYLDPKKGAPKKLENILKIYGKTSQRMHRGALMLQAHNKKLGMYLRELKYERGIIKRILGANEEYCKGFLKGLLEADGYTSTGYGKIQQTNRFFIDCAALACYKAGYLFSIARHKQSKNGYGKNPKKDYYLITISDPSIPKTRSYSKGNYLYTKIQNIEEVENPGMTYNIKVDKTESYLLRHVGSHNTNFTPCFEHLEKKPSHLLIYLTDMMGTFPEKHPRYPVIWVSTYGNTTPFGRLIKIK